MKALTAGSEIDSYCTRCRMDLGHRIVAMVGGAPKRVICLTCNSEHNYREPKTLKSPASVLVRGKKTEAKPSAAQRVTQKVKAEQERHETWATRALGKPVDAFTKYAMDRHFREGELVIHSKFGEGYVDTVLDGGKVSVMFRDGARTLAHRASP
ncbi:MAG: hypothetical protein EOO73_26170 [Myxococcales bacterium]|nr:MAG: hypothetical protein EOO73_26170 [Myxococcales bacterium]